MGRSAADALMLGIQHAEQGRMDDAVAAFEQAVVVDPRNPQAQFALGRARLATGDASGALQAFGEAVRLGMDTADLYYGIGSVHSARGDLQAAVTALGRAASRDPDHLGAHLGLLACLDAMPDSVEPGVLESALLPLLRGAVVNPRTLGHPCARLLERKHTLDDAHTLLGDQLTRLYLSRTVNVSAPVERLLTVTRSRWLAEPGALTRDRWPHAAAVAIQCFLNEFVWTVTEEEARAVDALETRVSTALEAGNGPDEAAISDLLLLACYRPLWRLGIGGRLAAIPRRDWPESLADLMRLGLHDPLRERALEDRIASGAPIGDGVSKAVRTQYEENPYPRWTAMTRGPSERILDRVRRAAPGFAPQRGFDGALRVLVAGCGTGMDAIDLAMHVRDATVTAIDLSRASLAYGARKAEEYGLDNLRFRHEDILAFAGDDGPYHMINSVGVLHHMEDIAAGLDRLARLLVPGGLMKLALYSRIARAPLMAARADIRAAGYGPAADDIRRFRREVIEAGDHGPHRELMGTTDFYSLSECRDLLFHVQELQVDIPEIRDLLAGAGLGFLGFEIGIPAVLEGYRREHPEAALDDLDAWHAYERRHPESFRGMYAFWCRKK